MASQGTSSTEEHDGRSNIISLLEIHRFMERCMTKVGTSESDAKALADVLVAGDHRGHFSHGLNRLEMYVNDVKSKICSIEGQPEIINETAATAYVDGKNLLGPVVGNFSMKLAIKKAKESGIGWVVAKGSNHYGIAGWYSMMACKEGLLGMSFTNTSPFVAPTRGKKPVLGTNPITLAAPAKDGDSFVLDMATCAVAVGKIEMQDRKRESIPEGWGMNSEGKITTDPKEVLNGGSLLPLGGAEHTSGYKGYGLAMMVEVFCGLLAGATYGPNIHEWLDTSRIADLGQCFIAINPDVFAPGFQDRMSDLMKICRNQEPAEGESNILVPGDPEREHIAKCDAQGGICYHDNQIKYIMNLSETLGVTPPQMAAHDRMLHTEITKVLYVVRRPLCLFNETLFTVSGKKLKIKLRFIKNYRNMASQGTNSTEEHGGRSNIISLPEIHSFMERCMTKVGTSESDAKALADVLVAGDHRGHFSHGLNRLEMYVNDVKSKICSIEGQPEIINETAATAYVDGKNLLGPVVGNFSMKLAIKKAKESGIGWVVAKGSNHYGIAGWYSMMACKEGLLGMSFTNTSPFVAPTRGKKPVLGTNPITLAAPAKDGDSFVLDMATCAVAVGKIEMQDRKRESIPEGWGMNSEGKITTDPKEVLNGGSLLPLGGAEHTSGYKGYGLAMMVEVFCGLLAGAAYGPNIRRWLDTSRIADLGQCFVAINPDVFAPSFQDRMSDLMEICRNQEPAEGESKILVPGDPEREHIAKCDAQGGICYHENQIKYIMNLSEKLGVTPPQMA
ncbi:uncharacterized protein LOC143227487 [Tachypleus tridentatus]|uniref:uncharacterized protein LOC143227487 n=1 Tax=Tachypleus tridentatus TaxID=6853 RepID=UPI003FCEE8CE